MHCAANYIREDISIRLTEIFVKYRDYSLIICGYSLGAGIGAILSLMFKSRYPDLKCYGIAMPGSVLSEDLSVASRDFIYSFVVDVDMICRASRNSLENLRDRLVDVLNKCDHCKLNVLTRTLIKRRQVFHTIDEQTNLIKSIKRDRLVLPGTIIHLYSTDRVRMFTGKRSYHARISSFDQFRELIVHPRMWFDHFPASYNDAFTHLLEESLLNNSSSLLSKSSVV